MTIDRDALVEKALAAALDKPSATTPRMLQFASSEPDDVADLRAVIVNALDAILPDVQADAWDEGWTASESYDGHYAVPTNPYRKVASDERVHIW